MQTDNISWIWEKSTRRKHIALHVDDDCLLRIKTPVRTSKRHVDALIREKRVWIEKSLIIQEERIHPKFPQYEKEGKLFFMGESFDFHVENKRGSLVEVLDGKVSIQAQSEAQFKKALQKWYCEKTERMVELYIDFFNEKIKKRPLSIGYRYYKRRWGSCDQKNNLMFNALLSVHKEEHIKYVVAHELAHMTVKNHSKAFYREGERILVGFKNLDKEIRN